MSVYNPCGSFEDYDGTSVCDVFTGGNRHMILVREGISVDLTSESEVQAAIDAGNAGLFTNLSISINDPDAVLVDSTVACRPQSVLTYNRTADVVDGKVTPQNVESWAALNGANGFFAGQVAIYSCSHNRQHVIVSSVQVRGGYTNPQSDEESQQFNLQLVWKAKDDPYIESANPIFQNIG